jgi:hypothetical protein
MLLLGAAVDLLSELAGGLKNLDRNLRESTFENR